MSPIVSVILARHLKCLFGAYMLANSISRCPLPRSETARPTLLKPFDYDFLSHELL